MRYLDHVFHLHHLALLIVATGFADVMGPLQFAAIGTFDVGNGLQGVVGSAHVAPRFGHFSLGYGHNSLLS
jgi:hypothetical protein